MLVFLSRFRYFFEIIALPAFIFLVLHLAGHAIMPFFENGHDHTHHEHGVFMWQELFLGIPFLILFVWIWHRPFFYRWIPCTHEKCQHSPQTQIYHWLAIGALCLHFFPEAGIRQMLLQEVVENFSWLHVGAWIAFASHFLVDIVVGISLSLHWKKNFWRLFSFLTIMALWITAFFVGETFMHSLEEWYLQTPILLGSAFVLSMFVHKPHKPLS